MEMMILEYNICSGNNANLSAYNLVSPDFTVSHTQDAAKGVRKRN